MFFVGLGPSHFPKRAKQLARPSHAIKPVAHVAETSCSSSFLKFLAAELVKFVRGSVLGTVRHVEQGRESSGTVEQLKVFRADARVSNQSDEVGKNPSVGFEGCHSKSSIRLLRLRSHVALCDIEVSRGFVHTKSAPNLVRE